jgi:hypothetical protein
MSASTARPGANDYAPYYDRYISRVSEGDIVSTLTDQLPAYLELIRSIPESRGTHRYAPGKWSIKESLGHVNDTERIFAYRGLRIARGDATPLPGFEQNDYIAPGRFDERTLSDLAEEFAHIRRASIALFAPLDDEALDRRGTASGFPVTVRAMGYIIAGHALHHMAILRERYL